MLSCIAVEQQYTKRYPHWLQCNHGVQDTLCQESELEGHSVSITASTGGEESAPKITLHEAATKSNLEY